MTRRELINALLNGDMNEKIWIIINAEDGDSCYPITFVDSDTIGFADEEDK